MGDRLTRLQEAISLRLLKRRLGSLVSVFEVQAQALSLVQLENLGEALLDFREGADLDDWLRSHH